MAARLALFLLSPIAFFYYKLQTNILKRSLSSIEYIFFFVLFSERIGHFSCVPSFEIKAVDFLLEFPKSYKKIDLLCDMGRYVYPFCIQLVHER